jgi:GNAT superfamily N-acetyltransferase
VNSAPRPLLPLRTCSSDIGLTDVEARALAFLLPLSNDYPGIGQWYMQKVVPGLRRGTRMLLPVERDGALAGLGIAKNEPDERKICTVRVAPSHTGRGIGVRLFDGMLKWLNDDRPHLTVSDAKLPQFERIFDYYGFDITSTRAGLYVPDAVELGYNEKAASDLQSQIIEPRPGALPSLAKPMCRAAFPG